MFLVASTPRPRSEPVAAVVAAHWSNIQLTRVELSTPDATTKIGEKRRNTALPQLGFGAEGVWKSRDKERRKRRAGRKTSGGQSDRRSTTQDNQWTSRRRASSRQVQSKRQTDEDRTDKSSAMETSKKKSTGRSR